MAFDERYESRVAVGRRLRLVDRVQFVDALRAFVEGIGSGGSSPSRSPSQDGSGRGGRQREHAELNGQLDLVECVANAAFELPLPRFWSEEKDEQERIYFWHCARCEASWDHPLMASFAMALDVARSRLATAPSPTAAEIAACQHVGNLEARLAADRKAWALSAEHDKSFVENLLEARQHEIDAQSWILARVLKQLRRHQKQQTLLGGVPQQGTVNSSLVAIETPITPLHSTSSRRHRSVVSKGGDDCDGNVGLAQAPEQFDLSPSSSRSRRPLSAPSTGMSAAGRGSLLGRISRCVNWRWVAATQSKDEPHPVFPSRAVSPRTPSTVRTVLVAPPTLDTEKKDDFSTRQMPPPAALPSVRVNREDSKAEAFTRTLSNSSGASHRRRPEYASTAPSGGFWGGAAASTPLKASVSAASFFVPPPPPTRVRRVSEPLPAFTSIPLRKPPRRCQVAVANDACAPLLEDRSNDAENIGSSSKNTSEPYAGSIPQRCCSPGALSTTSTTLDSTWGGSPTTGSCKSAASSYAESFYGASEEHVPRSAARHEVANKSIAVDIPKWNTLNVVVSDDGPPSFR